MRFTIESEQLNGVVVLVPKVFQDERGFFWRPFDETSSSGQAFRPILSRTTTPVRSGTFCEACTSNGSLPWGSSCGSPAEAHSWWPWTSVRDLLRWENGSALRFSAQNRRQVWAPAGFARGFCVLSDFAEIQYKCTGIYNC
jgi:dTDP-4-dehydrorhamnose 3,5-epimerase